MTEKKNFVLVVENKEGRLHRNLKEMATDFDLQQTSFSDAREILRQCSPSAVILDLDHQLDLIKEILDTFRDKHPHTYWVVSSEAMDPQLLIELMRLGISDFLKQPLDVAEFQNLIKRIQHCDTKRIASNQKQIRSVISFFSHKGGVGSSFLAVNTARALIKQNLGKVFVADFVLQHGNIAELFDLAPQYTVLDLMENLERVDEKLLENSLSKHKSGVFVLPCPKQPEDAEFFSAQESNAMLKIFKRTFNVNLLDIGHELTAATIACLDYSDLIFVVTTPDLASLCNTKTALQTFKKMGYNQNKVKLIVNRANMKGAIDVSVIEKNLGVPIFHKIVDDPVASITSINQGMPLHDLYKNEEIVKCFDKFVEKITIEAKKET